METTIIIALLVLVIILYFVFQMNQNKELRANREELLNATKENRAELSNALKEINQTIESKIDALISKSDENNKYNRETITASLKDFQLTFEKNVESFNTVQKEKFMQIETNQTKLIDTTEKKLEQMRQIVDEKLQKTLNERLNLSFQTVGSQLKAVQEGLGEMKNLAQDVGGLKKVLSNVKTRGNLGEVQLEMLLEQILAPDQYEKNVKTKQGSSDSVEFAIKLPGRDELEGSVYLPVDAKFPKDTYEQLYDAYENADVKLIDAASKNFENAIKLMAKDISEKYLDPPFTTDFGIMFLPFESIYAEVVRKSALLEELQRKHKIIVTGPTTFAAILNSLQMGFKTLAIQKRSSEVWKVLGAVKKEFENFGGMLEKAQKNFVTGLNQLDEVMGKRTKAIQRKLNDVESLNQNDSAKILPEETDDLT